MSLVLGRSDLTESVINYKKVCLLTSSHILMFGLGYFVHFFIEHH